MWLTTINSQARQYFLNTNAIVMDCPLPPCLVPSFPACILHIKSNPVGRGETSEEREEKERLAKERQIQTAILNIKKQFGKNAILKGLNYEEGATAKERNEQIGGHKA